MRSRIDNCRSMMIMSPMCRCSVREAWLDDAASIASLVTQLGYPSTPKEMAGRLKILLSLPEYGIFVAEADGEIVGLVGAYMGYSLEFSGTYGRLTSLIVDEKHRGAGIGRQLIAKIEDWIRDQGALLTVVTSSNHRADSHRFYENNGYLNTGIRFTKKL